MRLVVGLGNPGSGYARNRHNIGFRAVDAIAERHGFTPWRSRFQGLTADATVAGKKVMLLKPQTYMNLSGQSVGEAMRYFKLEPRDVTVFYDELDLPPGRTRGKRGGGAGGHNGIKSIDEHIGPDYWRIRLGIGHPGARERVTGHVLGDFAKADDAWLLPLLDALAGELPVLLEGGVEKYMNRIALLTKPPAPPKPPPAASEAP
jgi:PTH1 family peptidyl-tRNA hydrolase